MFKKSTLLFLLALLSGPVLWAQIENPLAAAKEHLQKNLKELDLTEADLTDFVVSNQYVTKHNKVTHVYLKQRHQGIEVHNAIFNINFLKNGEVLNYGNRWLRNLASRVNTTTPQISKQQAVVSLMQQFNIPFAVAPAMVKEISANEAVFDHNGIALEPIEVKLVYQEAKDRTVRLTWNVSFYETNAQHWWNARIDAETGQVIDYFDQVLHCDFGTPEALCDHDHAHTSAHFELPEIDAEETFEVTTSGDEPVYRVFPLFVESPNHGERTLEVNPADPVASPFGWHDTDGEEGAEFTITRGNNVHAYHDIFNQNQSNGDEPDGGDTLCFDFPLDLSTNRPYTQLDPVVTNLFYWNNVMHDLWYGYGFDEASGNFQVTNYTGEGAGGDAVQAEALDGSGTNNANMSTPPEGGRARMQMFLWGGQLPNSNIFRVESPEEVAGDYPFIRAAFGASFPEEPLTSEVVIVDDAVGTTTDACQSIVNGADIDGKIAMIDRGGCEFGFKVLAAEQEGAIAVIICNNQANAPGALAPGDVGDQVTIPSLMISQGLCAQLRLVENLTVSLSFEEFTEVPNPGPTGRSSDFDNGVIAHEYTHGISIRLTGGASTSGCLNNFEQAGEGWSDWFGLAMTTTSENNANQGRGIGTYAAGQPTTGGGIRPFPYTRNMNVNPHTYSDILSESVPHGVGSVWCAMIWDLYWNLVDEYGFDNDLYNGTGGNNIAMQLVLDGLKLQPCGPSFLDARDAIIAADMANNDGANLCLIWNTFARRGLGASAEVGGNEAFDLPFDCQERFKVRKTGVEAADAGSIITYTLEIANGRSEILPSEGIVIDELPTGVSFVAGSSECNITEVDGTLTINVGELGGNQTIECTYQVQVADEPFTAVLFEDDLETGSQNWATESPIGTNGWNRINSFANSGTNSFFVVNTETQSEQILVLNQPFTVGNTNPALSFWHFYNTESDWDGGVVEISTNGTNWIDLGDNMIQNGYPGALNENPDNVIGGQPAFNGNSGGWIQTIIDLSEYAGNDVQVRFRFGADAFVGGEGWYVDDIRFLDNLYTITNVACVEDSGDTFCSEVTTIVFGEVINNTTTINQAEKVSIFPNPTSGLITVQLDAPVTTAVDLQVLGIDGRVLYRQQFDSFQNTSVDLSDYGAGVYLVQLRTERGITTRRVVVE